MNPQTQLILSAVGLACGLTGAVCVFASRHTKRREYLAAALAFGLFGFAVASSVAVIAHNTLRQNKANAAANVPIIP